MQSRFYNPVFTSDDGLIGLELEGFFRRRLGCKGLIGVPGGTWSDEAGVNQGELITSPFASVRESIYVMRQMLEVNRLNMIFEPMRPACVIHNSGRWQEGQRYEVLRKGLAKEASLGQRHLVNEMTNHCGLHVNISGPGLEGDALATLVAFFNDIGPMLASIIHKEIGQGVGHLAIWRGFARSERLPKFGRRFADMDALRRFIESVPRLFKSVVDEAGNSKYVLCDGELQSMDNPLDLGVMWWLARPKLSTTGELYLEIRLAPSMSLVDVEYYSSLLVDMVNGYLNWFYENNKGRSVSSRDSAAPAYVFMNKYFPKYVPRYAPTQQQWSLSFYA